MHIPFLCEPLGHWEGMATDIAHARKCVISDDYLRVIDQIGIHNKGMHIRLLTHLMRSHQDPDVHALVG